MHGYDEAEFARKMDAALARVRTVLDRTRDPRSPADVPHTYGDKFLLAEFLGRATVASLLRRAVRTVDHVARYGGEEFVVVLVEATPQGALETAERIRALLAATEIDAGGTRVRVTASLGVTECVDEDRRAEDVLGRADSALYEAKRGGRNRVHCAFAD